MGEAAYDAYCAYLGQLTNWNALPMAIQGAWEYVAQQISTAALSQAQMSNAPAAPVMPSRPVT